MFARFHRQMEKCYEHGLPRCIAHSPQSILQVISQGSYQRMSVADVHSTIRRRHILVRDVSTEVLEFNEVGLQALRSLDACVRIQGESSANLTLLSHPPYPFRLCFQISPHSARRRPLWHRSSTPPKTPMAPSSGPHSPCRSA
jgi:hypothetical protein